MYPVCRKMFFGLCLCGCISLLVLIFLAGCGGGNSTPPPPPPPAPTVALSASPSAVTRGQSVTLTWSSTNATSCDASASPSESDWSGTQPTSGLQAVTPTSSGTTTYTLMCTGAGGSASHSASITGSASPLLITSGQPANGTAGMLYDPRQVQQRYCNGPVVPINICLGLGGWHYRTLNVSGFPLSATGGVLPYTWSWAAAGGPALPSGLSVLNLPSSSGCTVASQFSFDLTTQQDCLNGTPTLAGTYNVVLTVTDSSSPTLQTSANYSITIAPPLPLVITSAPPQGTVGVAYGGTNSGFRLGASGGVGPYTWSWAPSPNSLLPPGLSLSNGAISGVPTFAGSYNVVVTVVDSEAGSLQMKTSANFTIVIIVPTINTSPPPPIGTQNSPYSFTFTAFGGVPPLNWSETGLLPQGLTLNSNGVLSGTPAVTGPFPITVMMQDSGGQDAVPQPFTVQVFSVGFRPTGSMSTARVNHTASLLGNGSVLVTGGTNGSNTSSATAELYDPNAGTFKPTGSMTAARACHTATVLNNGYVLIAGGGSGSIPAMASAELYNTNNGTFAPTGTMITAHACHTATLLNDGMVLITGGFDATGNAGATAELYDPTHGTFASAGNMSTIRVYHAATLLSNFQVLVAGGAGPRGIDLTAAEIFDPQNGSFTPTGKMQVARAYHTATLLNGGNVLVAGGLGLSSAELFDPTSGTFTLTGSMQAARRNSTATLLQGGTVLVAGGLGLSSAELFTLTPAGGGFTPAADMLIVRSGHTATMLNSGVVLVIGGADASGSGLNTAELYK